VLTAFGRAVAALTVPALRRIVAQGLGLALLVFVALAIAVGAALHLAMRFVWPPLDWLAAALGELVVLALAWLLFPAVATLVLGFYLDRVVVAVEARDYPERGAPRRRPLARTLISAARLGLLTIAVNLLALPLYLFVPGMNLVLFLALNGYLLGGEYFEVVALRRLDAATAGAMRNRFGGRIFVGGVVIAGVFALPLVNLLAPIVATVFMLHLFEAWSRAEPHSLTRSAV
jgi:CysZ protein